MESTKEKIAGTCYSELEACIEKIIQLLKTMKLHEKVQALNKIRRALSKCSPFHDPVDLVEWIPAQKVQANDYNPNKVAPDEMELLYTSIRMDDFTQPIVSYRIDNDHYEITDGFHRNKIGRYPEIAKIRHGYLPLTIIDKPLDERIGSTIRHNRARGTHQIRSMSEIVVNLSKMGWSDAKIEKNLGMELDEVIRLKQISGLKEAFQNHEFSKSWKEFEYKNYK
ncbi:IbrB-like domain-containing protein [Lacrimispora sp.]|jgi:ParB-like chromosome segregation protein Spo0J|uniref:IbrB-like domain-containing protein n=1 Tax=Lacrimispora sp. TaxID=2719234 RepID=UPI0026D8156A|nr:ParB/RepB/Spo0J family partition protein [Lacrimispora sp.]